MRYLIVLTSAIVIATAFLPHAQLGGLIKKKIVETAKKPDQPTESKPADGTAKPSTPAASAPPDNNRNVLPITDTALTALGRGLQTEITLRAAYKKELEDQAARAKQYEECSNQAQTSPEMMAVAQKLSGGFNNAKTQEDVMKVTTQMSAERDAVIAKKCGQEPVRPASSEERLTEILKKAAATAGPIQ